MMERILADYILPDLGAEIMYGYDQVYINHPEVCATVTFQLMATDGLVEIADRIRKDKGFKPMHAMDEYTDDTCDNEGWYDFYVGLNGFTENHMDTCIDFIVVNADSYDNEDMYTIDLTPDEQRMIYDVLNDACVSYLGKSCEDLLNEAHNEMELCLKEEPYTASI